MNFIINIKNWYYQHKIETFGICLCLCLAILSADLGTVMYKHNKDLIKYVDKKSTFASAFTTSKSGNEGEIVHMYRSTDKTKLAILLKLENTSKIVADATKYQVFYTGYDVNKKAKSVPLSNPTGGFIMYDKSGLAMIYLINETGFESQPIELIVRCYETLKANGAKDDKQASDLKSKDSSYNEYDQFRMVINPGSAVDSMLSETSILDGDTFDPKELYQHAYVDADEAKIRSELKACVDTMYEQLTRILTYREDLKNLNISVPNLDKYIEGDNFTPYANKAVSNYYYTPNLVFEGGVAYPWFDYTLNDVSYLQTKPEGKEALDDKAYIETLGIKKSYTMPLTTEFNKQQVTKIDGSVVVLDNRSSYDETRIITQTVNDYLYACEAYLNAKQKYLCTLMHDYCLLEYNMNATGNSYTYNYGIGTYTNSAGEEFTGSVIFVW